MTTFPTRKYHRHHNSFPQHLKLHPLSCLTRLLPIRLLIHQSSKPSRPPLSHLKMLQDPEDAAAEKRNVRSHPKESLLRHPHLPLSSKPLLPTGRASIAEKIDAEKQHRQPQLPTSTPFQITGHCMAMPSIPTQENSPNTRNCPSAATATFGKKVTRKKSDDSPKASERSIPASKEPTQCFL